MLEIFCVAFTPKFFKLPFPKSDINTDSIPYTDSFKYLEITFTSSHKDNNYMLLQIRMSYALSNKLVRLFHSCSKSFCGFFLP